MPKNCDLPLALPTFETGPFRTSGAPSHPPHGLHGSMPTGSIADAYWRPGSGAMPRWPAARRLAAAPAWVPKHHEMWTPSVQQKMFSNRLQNLTFWRGQPTLTLTECRAEAVVLCSLQYCSLVFANSAERRTHQCPSLRSTRGRRMTRR